MLVSQQRKWLLFLALATWAVYLQTVGFGWVQLDDPHHIFENPAFQPPSLSHIVRFWLEPFFGMYIPFTYTVWQGVAFFSKSPSVFHLLNVTLHLINTFLVFSLTLFLLNRERKSQRSFLLAFIAALFFCVHPIQAESVAWISGTKDVLFGTTFLLALYFQFTERRRLSHLCFFLALTSKPTAVIGPGVLFILLYFFLHRALKDSLLRILPWMVMVLPFSVITKFLQADFFVQDLAPTWSRPLIALDTVLFYLQKTILPLGLTIDYGRTPNFILSLGALNIVLIIVPLLFVLFFSLRQKFPEIFGGFLIFILGFLPVSGLIAFQYQLFSTVADRYLYFSLFGAGLILAFALKRLVQTRFEKPAFLCTGIFLLLLGGLGMRQVHFWSSDSTLFTRAIDQQPNSFLAHNNYAFYLFYSGKPREAVTHFEKVVALRPKDATLRMNYAVSLLGAGEKQKGIAALEEAALLAPENQKIQQALNSAKRP